MSTLAVRSRTSAKPKRHADQRRLGHGLAVVGHAPPDHEASQRRGHDGEAEAGKQGAHQEGFEHVSSVAPSGSRASGRRMRLAGKVVAVVVMVVVEAERARGLRAEQPRVLGMLRHRLRHARSSTRAD